MKPLKLTMIAFGPYKNKEVIDFTELKDNKLFVISGATGAGKTTIFDAICFALYGSASGGDRENISMLRSDFADDDVHTVVELIFKLSNRTFRVLRQLAHVKQGNKTRTGDKYEFFEIIENGEVPAVDRQIVSEINEKIESLIGLTEDQFKQIVMLPQGEFRKLLTSETENKEEILRRLFKTERYNKMNSLLKEKRDQLEKQYASESNKMEFIIQNIKASLEERDGSELFHFLSQEHYNIEQVLTTLHSEILFYKEKEQMDKQQYIVIEQKLNQKQQFFQRAQLINSRFQLLEQKEEHIKQLNKQQPVFLEKEQLVEASLRASSIEPYEKQLLERREELVQKEKQLRQQKEILTKTVEKLNQVKSLYNVEKNRVSERDKINLQLERLKDTLPIVMEMNQTKQELIRFEQMLKETRITLQKMKENTDAKATEVDKVSQQIKENEEATSTLQEKQAEIQAMLTQYNIFENYRKKSLEQIKLRKELDEKEKAYNQAKNEYEKQESLWFHNQASILASQLKSGEHCPVCGSTNHPSKATSSEIVINKEELDRLKQTMNEKHEIFNDVMTNYRACAAQLKEIAKEIETYDVALELVVPMIEKIKEKGKKLRKEVEQLEEKVEQNKVLKTKLEELNKSLQQLNVNREQINDSYQKELTKYTAMEAAFKERIKNIDKEMQDVEQLENEISKLQSLKNELDRRWEIIQHHLQVEQEAYTTAQVNVMNIENQYRETTTIVASLEMTFKQHLQQNQFNDEAQYRKANITVEKREALQNEITAYKQTVVAVEKQIEDLKEELKDAQKLNIAMLEDELAQWKEQYEQAFAQFNHSKNQLEVAKTMKENMIELREKREEAERQLAIVTDLYDTLRGQNNRKISFERYLQIDYLEQITHAANERFKQLSNGQFYLVRSDRQEAYGRQSGLAIDVYDAYTGQMRDVKTLSGGEKFIASLCLALGMSDVIQSFQGSISIETMFIDEGFGSLDEESLYKSIDALIELQNTGRTIGVISHVEELKAMLPAMLQVTKTKEGYSKTKFVLK